jgi:hypothetical protein
MQLLLACGHTLGALAMLFWPQPAWQIYLPAATTGLDFGLSLALASRAKVNTCFEGMHALP